jgi:transaldolase
MAMTLLKQLRDMTIVVADSGDVDSITRFKPQDSTTNPALIAAAAAMPKYRPWVDQVLREAADDCGPNADEKTVTDLTFRRLAVAFGRQILKVIPGRVSTEVDARVSYDRDATLKQARDLAQQYRDGGVSPDRVLIKIAATWEGIQAAKQLELEGIHCNLTLVFGIHQAAACADAKVTLISPSVGRILDWHRRASGQEFQGADDPGVQSATNIYNYLKKFSYRTAVMGASFRNISEIVQLAGCDLLTISPKLLAQLDSLCDTLPRVLSPQKALESPVQQIVMDRETFEALHRSNPMASEELTRGVEGFGAALAGLERLLSARLAVLKKAPRRSLLRVAEDT